MTSISWCPRRRPPTRARSASTRCSSIRKGSGGGRAHRSSQGRSWVWIEDGRIHFKAEASAWTPHAVQLQQVWVDPELRNQGYGRRGLCDLIRLLLERVPRVCLFVRADNPAAIRLYETVGMERVGFYRSLLF